MPLVPLKMPAGVYANGTEYEAAGRWHDASLVRWHDGSLRPIGGWRTRIDTAFSAYPRAMIAWQDNSSDRHIAAGSYNKLYAINAAAMVYDITPVGLVSGILDAAVNTGFSGGLYGTSYYGTSRADTGNYSSATTWSLDNWGEYLVACSDNDGTLYEWQLNTASPATAIANAPINNLGLVVTEQRFLVALGAGGNPRKVQWSDQENNQLWSAASTNQAGEFTLQSSGQIMTAVRAKGQTLVLTDTDAHTMTYIGAPFVMGFERAGTSCGTISRKAVTVTDAGVFWMGQKGFYIYSGSTVQPVACEVYDRVFSDLNRSQQSKIWSMSIGQEGEVWWFYPSSASNEIDRYVAFNYRQNYWTIGSMTRTAGFDRGVFSYPMMATDSVIEHEVGFNYDGADVFAKSGPAQIAEGDQIAQVLSLIPDENTRGDVTATFSTRLYPNGVESTYGPYTMATPTDVRFSGRQITMRVDGNTLSDWRVGTMRADVKMGGKR